MERLNYILSLVKQVKRNDVVAMRTLYDLFSKEMLAVSFRITNDWQEAEDIIQEGFLTSFQKIAQLKSETKYGGWLKQIIVNKSLANLKKKVSFQDLTEIEVWDENDNDDNWYQDISFEKITAAIQELPEGSRQVFSLFLLENYKHKEIAAMLSISVSTSKSQYRYALKLLKEKLNGFTS
ncbi:MAG: RNA polymerase sigma factor [Saprospiraceae bacterium]